MVHKGALETAKRDLTHKPPCFAAISVQNGAMVRAAVHGIGQSLTAVQRIADTLKGAGTDQPRRLADQEATCLTKADTLSDPRTQNGAGFGAYRCSKHLCRDQTVLDQLALLCFKGLSCAVSVKGSAEDE